MNGHICLFSQSYRDKKEKLTLVRTFHEKLKVKRTEKSLSACSTVTTMWNDNKQREEVTMAGKTGFDLTEEEGNL